MSWILILCIVVALFLVLLFISPSFRSGAAGAVGAACDVFDGGGD